MLPRLAFLEEPCQHTPNKNVLNMIKLRFDFRFKRCGYKATEKRKAKKKTINCHYPDISWNPRCLLSWSSHTNFPLFSTDFQLSTRMLIFRKQTRKQNIFFLAFPSLNTSIFTTYLKIASTLRPFERLDSKVNSQNGKVSKLFP
jgi:hypothetical protein